MLCMVPALLTAPAYWDFSLDAGPPPGFTPLAASFQDSSWTTTPPLVHSGSLDGSWQSHLAQMAPL